MGSATGNRTDPNFTPCPATSDDGRPLSAMDDAAGPLEPTGDSSSLVTGEHQGCLRTLLPSLDRPIARAAASCSACCQGPPPGPDPLGRRSAGVRELQHPGGSDAEHRAHHHWTEPDVIAVRWAVSSTPEHRRRVDTESPRCPRRCPRWRPRLSPTFREELVPELTNNPNRRTQTVGSADAPRSWVPSSAAAA